MIPRDEIAARLIEGKLGPDALVISEEEFTRRLSQTRRPIKVALLDQKLVLGIGNLYASEMLHAAGIDPCQSASQIHAKQYKVLHGHMLRILHEAILYEGSTLSDGTYRNALNQSGGYQNQHRVYDREGEPCPSCRRDLSYASFKRSDPRSTALVAKSSRLSDQAINSRIGSTCSTPTSF